MLAETTDQSTDRRREALSGALRRQVAQILDTDPAGLPLDRPLVALGVDSLAAAELAEAIESTFGVRLELAELFAGLTLDELAERIWTAGPLSGAGAAAGAAPQGASAHQASPAAAAERLSWGQRALWLVDRLAPGNPAYVIAGAARVRGALDVPRFRRAVEQLVARHAALRANLVESGEGADAVALVTRAEPTCDFREVDADGDSDQDVAATLARLAYAPFDLAAEPLLRVVLCHRGADDPWLAIAVHHVVADFASMGILVDQLGALYRGERLAPLAATYQDFVRAEAELLASPEGERLAEHWRQALPPGLPALDLPTDRPRPALQTFRGATREMRLPAAVSARLRSLAAELGATPFMALLAVFLVLMERQTGQEQVLVGTPTSGRPGAAFTGVVGYFVNPVVVRGDLSGDPAFATVLARVRESVLAALAHQRLPFPLIAERLAAERDPSRPPVFQAMFGLYRERHGADAGLTGLALGASGIGLDLGGLDLASEALARPGAQFELNLAMGDTGGAFAGALEYNADLFDAATALRLLGQLTVLATAVAGDGEGAGIPGAAGAAGVADRRISQLPLLSAAEAQQLREWNDTSAAFPGEPCLHELIAAQAARTPGVKAVEAAGADGRWASLTYRELEARASHLAGRLRRLGVGPDTVVAITAERSLGLMVGLLGILKAGGAYLPLDPEYPRDRLDYMLRDSGARVLLVQGAMARPPAEGPAVTLLLDDPAAPAPGRGGDPPRAPGAAPAARPDNLAYVIYTSGSSGRPKGTMNSHRGIVNRLTWMRQQFPLGPGDRVLQKTPAGFDVSVWELFWPLLTGARLVMAAPGGHRDSAYLLRTLAERQITYAHFVPAMLRVFLDHLEGDPPPTAARSRLRRPLPRLQCILASGEALPYDVQQRCHALLGVPLHNLYGPTEAAVEVTRWACVPTGAPADPEAPRPVVPIGRPLANTSIHLLDRWGGKVPAGVPGELHIGGVQLARGYLGRPELTAEKFVPDPYAQLGGQRLYRSGDVARHRTDGAIEFLGRADNQVKIRGVRTELGEIEAALARHPAVAEALAVAVAAAGDADGPRLAAYLVLTGAPPGDPEVVAGSGGSGPEALIAELRRSLRESLPEPMVPAAFMVLAALPLSANGKLDRKALPAPDWGTAAAAASRRPGALTPTETILAGIWAELLGREEVAAEDSFFDLGGHSLLATRLVSRVRRAFGIELPLGRVFARPTLGALAGDIAARIADGAAAGSGDSLGARGSAGGGTTTAAPTARRARRAALARRADAATGATGAAAARAALLEDRVAAIGRGADPAQAAATLAGIWAELLEHAEIAAQDNFFDLGGHSLLANRLVSRVRQTFGVELPLNSAFANPTLAAMAGEIVARMSGGGDAAADSSLPAALADGSAATVLSFAQERIWFVSQLAPDSAGYNMPGTLRLRGRLAAPEYKALAGALQEIVRRHEVLRSTYPAGADDSGLPLQVVSPDCGVALPLIDLTGLVQAAAATGEAVAAALGRQPFLLATGPLLRTALLRLAADDHLLVVVLHHIVGDGWSVGIFLRELAQLHAAFAAGEPSPLPELALQYADFARWQRRWLNDAALAAPLAFWRQALAGAPARLALPTDRPRPATQSSRGARLTLPVPEAMESELRRVARRDGATLFMVLLAAFDLLLWRWSGEADLVVGVPVANRDRLEIEGLIGCFVNTLALRVDVAGNPTLAEVLARARQASLAAFAHQEMPFEQLVEALAPRRDPSATPLFQVALAVQGRWEGMTPAGIGHWLRLEPRPVDIGVAKFDLTVEAEEAPGYLSLAFEYCRDLFDPATMLRLASRFGRMLDVLTSGDVQRGSADLDLLAEAERHQLLVEWAGGAAAWSPPTTLHEAFAMQARRQPAAVALTCGGASLTWGELDRRSTRLARRLRRMGVGPEVCVAVWLDRSPEMVVALLGVLKSGGAYVPFDASFPRRRWERILIETGATVLLTREGRRESLPLDPAAYGVSVLCLDGADPAASADPDSAGNEMDGNAGADRDIARLAAGPDNLAYVMYTSGSSGEPKGVGVVHRGVVRLVRDNRLFDFGPGQVFLQVLPLAFDASTLEIWGPLLNGNRLVLFPPGLPDRDGLREVVERQGVTAIVLTTSLFHQLAEGGLGALRSLCQLVTGGEALSPPLAHRAWRELPATVLINAYGPTEGTVAAACYPMRGAALPAGDGPRAPAASGGAVPIGRPIADTTIRVCDRSGQPVPAGVAGEILIGGGGLARGYLGRPDLTAERFVPDPWSGHGAAAAAGAGWRLYRTGDLARWLPDGNLEFLGRIDHQVKLRGFRIEPGEIEACLVRHPDVERGVVQVREAAPGDRRLVAYVVPKAGAAASPEFVGALRTALAHELPAFMVPAAFVFLAALPLTMSGKLDARALPPPVWGAPAGAASFIAPRTPTEQLVADLWAELLAVPAVGAGDDFFALGGHSLLAVRAVARLREVLGVEIPLARHFELPRLADLARELDALGRQALAVPLVRLRQRAALPLSFGQERLWFLDRLAPGSPAYNVPAALGLRGCLHRAALAASLGAIRQRHEVLRTTFVERDGGVVAVVAGDATPCAMALPLIDLRALPADLRARVASELAAGEARRAFDLAAGPLLRAVLLRLAGVGDDAEHWLLLTLHHIVSDGWSVDILARELSFLYRGALAAPGVSGGAAQGLLPSLPIQYADFAAWQRAWLTGETLAVELRFWRRQLAGERGLPPALVVPLDRPRPAGPTERGARRAWSVPQSCLDGLSAAARRHGATLFMLLLAAFDTLLLRHGGESDLAVGTPVANRDRLETQDLVGLFVNTLVLRVDAGGDPSFAELVGRARRTAMDAYAHQDLPFDKLVGELAPQRRAGAPDTPFFQVALALQTSPPALTLPGLRAQALDFDSGTAKFDLSLSIFGRDGDGLAGTWTYRSELFDAATVARLGGQLGHLLAAVAGNAGGATGAGGWHRRLADLPLLGTGERHQVLVEWNVADWRGWQDWPGDGDELLHTPFERQAALRPAAAAVVDSPPGDADAERVLSYGQLAVMADRLAAILAGAGVGPETIVGLYAAPSPALIAGMLAVLKVGGAFLPLDATAPRARIAELLADAGAVAVLTDAAADGAGGLTAPAADVSWVSLAAVDAGVAATVLPPPAAAARRLDPDLAAYVIYTSGSSGRPKGVVVSHRSIANRMRFQVAADLTPGSRVLQRSRLAFDVSVVEVFGPLWAGATLVLTDAQRLQDPVALARSIARGRITNANVPPALLPELLAQEAFRAGGSLRRVVAGGDRIPGALPGRFYEAMAAPAPLLVARYGPTEATVSITEWVCGCDPEAATVPLGRPIAGTRLYVLDARGSEMAPGAAGELCLGGVCLARGYLARPDLTAAAFVPDPFADGAAGAGGRLYRTGDLVRQRGDGVIEFLGRIDRQVKLRGFRVELAEVEVALARHPEVAAAAVVDREDPQGSGKRLVAYVVIEGTSGADGAGSAGVAGLDAAGAAGVAGAWNQRLRDFLAGTLPPYMVPAAVVVLPRLPRTANGKIDRAALPEPLWAAAGAGEPEHGAPRTPVEELLAECWRELLAVPGVGPDDSFFELGGHSLLATRLVARVRDALQVELPLRRVFESPTLAAQARDVEALLRGPDHGAGGEAPGAGAFAPAPRLERRPAAAGLVLSYAQERLWFLTQLEVDSAAYNIPGMLRLRGPLDRRALAASLREIVRRHQVLRCVYPSDGGRPAQVDLADLALAMPFIDLSGLAAPADPRTEARRLGERLGRRPFDLAAGPVLVVALCRLGADEHRLLLVLHHIAADGWSVGVFLRELRELYGVFAGGGGRGSAPPLPALPVQYADYAHWQRSWLAGDVLDGHLAYWRQALAGAPPRLDLPADRPRPAVRSDRGAQTEVAVGSQVLEPLRGWGRRQGATLFMVLLAAFDVLLHRLTGEVDLVVGTPIANRERREIEGLIGCFVNTLALRADLSGAPAFASLVEQVKRRTLAAFAHQALPFERLVEALAPRRDQADTPLFQVMLVLQNIGSAPLWTPGGAAGLTLEPAEVGSAIAKFDLTVVAIESGGGLRLTFEYSTDLFDGATVKRLARQLAALLTHAADGAAGVQDPAVAPAVADLPLLGAAERQQIREWNSTAVDWPRELCLHHLVERQARRTPRAVAVTAEPPAGAVAAADGAGGAAPGGRATTRASPTRLWIAAPTAWRGGSQPAAWVRTPLWRSASSGRWRWSSACSPS